MRGNHSLPKWLSRRVTKNEIKTIIAWWDTLSPTEQTELRKTDRRKERLINRQIKLGPPGDDAWITLTGYFVDLDSIDADEPWWPQDLYEYYVNHEVYLIEPRVLFHICTHPEGAGPYLKNGLIPSHFTCPLQRQHCPMKTIMAQGKGRHLRLLPTIKKKSPACDQSCKA